MGISGLIRMLVREALQIDLDDPELDAADSRWAGWISTLGEKGLRAGWAPPGEGAPGSVKGRDASAFYAWDVEKGRTVAIVAVSKNNAEGTRGSGPDGMPVYSVKWSQSDMMGIGIGSMLYELALEWASESGFWLASDRDEVSPAAQKVWSKMQLRGDIEKVRLDDEENTMTPRDEDNFEVPKDWGGPLDSVWGPAARQEVRNSPLARRAAIRLSPLMWGYRKGGGRPLWDELARLGLTVTRKKDE